MSAASRGQLSGTPGDDRRLSIVVVLLARDPEYLRRNLAALRAQSLPPNEILVPYEVSLTELESVVHDFPDVRFLPQPGGRSYAECRAIGVSEATGDVVAVTEDHCTPDPEWCQAIMKLHREMHVAVGGAVEKDGADTNLNWAIYLNDFGRYMLPIPEGPAEYLTDCNVSYKRTALDEIRSLWEREFHETTVNWELARRGMSLWLTPALVVRQQRSLQLAAAIRERYEFGRLFACTRVAETGLLHRLLYAAASPLLPAVLIGRVAKNVFGKGRAVHHFWRSLPVLVVLALCWTWGEFLGYLTGSSIPEPAPAS